MEAALSGGDAALLESVVDNCGSTQRNPPTICFMIATRQRPQMLERCLRSIFEQIGECPSPHQIVVVENDPTPTSLPVVEALQSEFPDTRVAYLVEHELGIPFARNRGVQAGLASGCDWLAFIDDDEWLQPNWLKEMTQAARGVQADVLTGPVKTIYPTEPPVWMRLRKRPRRRTGQKLPTAATNNTLVRAEWLRRHEECAYFDSTFRFTGGSDAEFFYRLVRAGGRICWVDDAEVAEEIMAEQLTLAWQLRRTQRYAANAVQIERTHHSWPHAVRRQGPRALKRLAIALPALPIAYALSFVLRRTGGLWFFDVSKKLAGGWGTLQALCGVYPQPYRRVTGR